jgi:DNA-binding beta-propeller fold protein YncE
MGLRNKVEKVLLGLSPAGVPQRQLRVEAKAASYGVLVRDSGTVFTTRGATGAIVFTLPALADSPNCHYWFCAIPDETMTIASAEGNNMIASGDVAASSVAYDSANEIIGGVFYVVNDGTQWLVFPHLKDEGQAFTIV